jgi:membrane protease YdiL (CAAX protease family)/uncharacterized RDD family membrane protein YckC
VSGGAAASTEAVGPGTDREYVGLWRRLLAALIDNLMWFFGVSFLLGGALDGLYQESPDAAAVAVFVVLSLWFNYFSFCEWRWGQTVGKNATAIEVRSLDGSGLSFGQASMRNLLRIVDLFLIGPIMVSTTDRKQRLGDKVAGTVVVRRPVRARSDASSTATAADAALPAGASVAAPAGAATLSASSADRAAPTAPSQLRSGAATRGDPTVGAPAPAGADGDRGLLPEIGWTLRNTWVGLFAGMMIGFFLAPALVLPFDPELESVGALLAAQTLLGTTLIVISVAAATNWRFHHIRGAFSSLGLRRFAPSAIGWMFATMFAYYVVVGLFAQFVLQPEQDDIGGQLGVGDDSLLVAVLAVVLIAGLAPFAEELFFRGFFFSGLRSRLSFLPAALVAGLVFGAVHAATGITTVIPLAALGFGLCWLYEKTGSLWPCVILHAINNGLALALIS